ncbi:hypothetical protein [Clostridium sp.]|uniref:hypothetical protein n=1 Tax=Clostridium sp. TaxID=1506 RepID=UPI0032164DB2
MSDKNTSLVWEYLKNHFANSDSPVHLVDLISTGLSANDIGKSIDVLEADGCININHKYRSEPIESINL